MHSPADARMYSAEREDTLVRRSEIIISSVLRGGVILSATVIAIGVAAYFFAGSSTLRYPHGLRYPDSIPTLWFGLTHGDPLAIIALGLILLLATPVLRVAVSVVAFAVKPGSPLCGDHPAGPVHSDLQLSAWTGWRLSMLGEAQPLFFLVVFVASVGAGLIGSLVGLGGGVFIVPLLTLAFGLPFETAVGASIVSVIATSSGAAAAYVKDHLTNLRLGMFLEIATTIGAVTGAYFATVAPTALLFILFGLILIISAIPLIRKIGEELPEHVVSDRWARLLSLPTSYPDAQLQQVVHYEVTRVPLGFGLMYVAGAISGLLGIGSGTFKVLAMDSAMRLPMKVSTTTSNFMIGVTAAASAGIYWERGDIHPLVAAPVALGVLVGATIGARTLVKLSNSTIRKIFVPLILLVAIRMLISGIALLAGH